MGISEATRVIKDPGDQRALTLRGKLLFTPTPDLRTLITLSHVDAYGPQTGDVVRPFADHITPFPFQPRFQTRADVAIADMSWSVTEGLTFSTFATASDFRTLRFARLADGNARIDGREYTLEPRLRFGSGDDKIGRASCRDRGWPYV